MMIEKTLAEQLDELADKLVDDLIISTALELFKSQDYTEEQFNSLPEKSKQRFLLWVAEKLVEYLDGIDAK